MNKKTIICVFGILITPLIVPVIVDIYNRIWWEIYRNYDPLNHRDLMYILCYLSGVLSIYLYYRNDK